ncbi:hypothetical protein C5745_09945 [Sphingobacterium haloxyli]|uniref:Uncharacterized protein n=1 Tax=Sphingobacterium haloxyli TaxID=2100533 RepID=A0A2S9J4E5_9SPHI|nr:hypothetical protein C5745_09945 [Sphingobacterium haloxyli]
MPKPTINDAIKEVFKRENRPFVIGKSEYTTFGNKECSIIGNNKYVTRYQQALFFTTSTFTVDAKKEAHNEHAGHSDGFVRWYWYC